MTILNIKALADYAPAAQLKREASKTLNETIFVYKQLYYGLRSFVWQKRDKQSIFYEAMSKGELDGFRVAPGVRAEDGSYTKSEWDFDRLNKYLWERFTERFASAFEIERIAGLSSIKDVVAATNELLGWALDNYGEALVGNQLQKESAPRSLTKGKYSITHAGIKLDCHITITDRTIKLSADEMPSVTIYSQLSNGQWHTAIGCDMRLTAFDASQAKQFARMMNWASEIASRMNEFLADPEGFIGADKKVERQHNLQSVKERLLQLNADAYEKRKVTQESTIATQRINEATTAIDEAATPIEVEEAQRNIERVVSENHDKLDSNPYAKLAGPLKVYKVLPTQQRKQQRDNEAQRWLAANAHQIPEALS